MSEASLDVAALRAALAAATPGPWARRDQYVRTVGTEPDYVAESWKYADAELIVLLRNNAEALLDALVASEAKVAKFNHILDQYTDGKISKVACVSLMLNAAGWQVSP